jgi:hypothetical protein
LVPALLIGTLESVPYESRTCFDLILRSLGSVLCNGMWIGFAEQSYAIVVLQCCRHCRVVHGTLEMGAAPLLCHNSLACDLAWCLSYHASMPERSAGPAHPPLCLPSCGMPAWASPPAWDGSCMAKCPACRPVECESVKAAQSHGCFCV